MVEGIIIGVVSALITVVILGFTYNIVIDKMAQNETMQVIGYSFLNFSDMLSLLILVYIVMGIGIGTIGSAISMKKYLEV